MLDALEQFVMRRNKNDSASLSAIYPVCLGFPNGMKLCMDSTYCMNDHVGSATNLPETEECVERSLWPPSLLIQQPPRSSLIYQPGGNEKAHEPESCCVR